MKVAIIGYGRIGRVHAAAVRAERDVERLAICDPAVATPEASAIAGGTPVYGDVDEDVSCAERECDVACVQRCGQVRILPDPPSGNDATFRATFGPPAKWVP